MNIKAYLDKVAYIDSMDLGVDGELYKVYKSKYDNSYIAHVGLEDNVKFLAKREITEELTHGVGFSPKDGKWYGWSHRAIYGFEIGSTCKKGDCNYKGSDIQEQKDAAIRFWENDDYRNVRCDGIVEQDGEKFFDIKWEYLSATPNKKLHGTTGGSMHHIKSLGRGEWTAKTLDDAKQMAVDFNEGVS